MTVPFRYPVVIRVPTGFRTGQARLERAEECFRFEVRTLSRAEFEACRTGAASPAELEEQVLALAVLKRPERFHGEPFDLERVHAGVGHHLVAAILSLSGFGEAPHPSILRRAAAYLAGEEARFDLLIMTAFNYTLEQLLSLDAESWHRLVGLASQKLAVMGIDPAVILDPEGASRPPTPPGDPQHASRSRGPRHRGAEIEDQTTTFSFLGQN